MEGKEKIFVGRHDFAFLFSFPCKNAMANGKGWDRRDPMLSKTRISLWGGQSGKGGPAAIEPYTWPLAGFSLAWWSFSRIFPLT